MDGRTPARPAHHARWQNISPTVGHDGAETAPASILGCDRLPHRPAVLPHVFSGAFADRLKSAGKYR